MRSLGDTLYNFHWVVPGELARSSQAYAGFLRAFLTRHGIRALVNLRGANPHWWWWRYETRICEHLGVAHLDVRLNSRNLPLRQTLVSLLDAFDAAPMPLLIKCSGGQDRTSLGSALYLVHRRGWSAFDEAQAQFAGWPYLHWPKAQQRWMQAFLPYAREQTQDPLSAWIREAYAPAEFAAWLERTGRREWFRPTAYTHPTAATPPPM
jgi:hypothetical protein